MSDLAAGVLVLAGGALAALSGIGQARFSDLFTRMHMATKPATLGILLIATGAMLRMESAGAVTLLVLIVILQFATGPVSAHLVGRAAHRHGDRDREAAVRDDLAEVDEL